MWRKFKIENTWLPLKHILEASVFDLFEVRFIHELGFQRNFEIELCSKFLRFYKIYGL